MKKPPTPAPGANPPGIISQRQFDEYSANWLAVSSDPEGAELDQSFRLSAKQLISGLSFPALQIARLVSTVGAAHIKARFLIERDEPTNQPHFTLALFATDALDARISSYYVADEYWQPAAEPAAAPKKTAAAKLRAVVTAAARTELPDVLARYWLRAWAALTRVAPAVFATSYGPLRGYTFEVAEFMLPLRQLARFDQEKLLVEFGLHEYYRPEGEGEGDALVQTFGLMLRLESSKMEGATGPILDMGAPCPPSC